LENSLPPQGQVTPLGSNSKESFSKKEPITEWEKINTLDC